MGRPFRAAAAAIARVNADGPIDLKDLARHLGLPKVGPARLVTWIVTGILGIHLDGLLGRTDGRWYSSEPAVWRFLAEVAREEEFRREEEEERRSELTRRGVALADVTRAKPAGLRSVG